MTYKRIMLKLSGESLAGKKSFGISDEQIQVYAKMIKQVHELGVELAIVVGGGNFWRGRTNPNMNRVTADQIGMLATTMNAMALNDAILQTGIQSKVMNSIEMPRFVDLFVQNKAVDYLKEKNVLIFAGGTGNPFFSTDSAAALRAAEIGAEVVLKGTMVDGVYDKDPHQYADAKKYEEISLTEVIAKDLKVMDSTAAALCRDNQIPMLVFSIEDPSNLVKILKGENLGTLVKP
ncbi:MAG: UMP kinase [Clostridiaceae bacterium]|nr:UMP kinase [Clostridiaceae bacterium]